jgi:hypothetical protein
MRAIVCRQQPTAESRNLFTGAGRDKYNSGGETNNVIYLSLTYTNPFSLQVGDAETENSKRNKEEADHTRPRL